MDIDDFINFYNEKIPYLTCKLKKLVSNFEDHHFYDFASLLRQISLSFNNINECKFIKLPPNIKFSRECWKEVGFEFTNLDGHNAVRPISSKPEFIIDEKDINENWHKLDNQRKNLEIPTDPFIKNVTGFKTYTSSVQREALARMFFMPEGHSLVINLPTGSGKSLMFQMPILKDGLQSGLTLVVVPTTSLAIDQARRMNELLIQNKISCDHPLAWYSELDETKKNLIKDNIRNGQQGILFVSPESVVGALLPSLFIAASKGFLKYLCIDEAHLLIDWGDSFRAEYQVLTAVRNGLLHSCKEKQFKTLLFSATITKEALVLIDNLFGPKENVHLVSGIILRPEPKYYKRFASSKIEQRNKIIELLKYVPKPVVIYTTLKKDAENIFNEIKKEKFSSIQIFHGGTKNKDEIVTQWSTDELDIIVATSAFGVGVDKSNVRTIIHATVPETLDRFYQEVGRSGRDGKSSNSILIYTDEDLDIARRMAEDVGSKTAGSENAFQRWEKMRLNSRKINFNNDTFYSINLTSPGPGLSQVSDANTKHNLMTLIIIARTGLIKIYKNKPEFDNFDYNNNVNNDVFWNNFYGNILIKFINDKVNNADFFKKKYNEGRSFIKEFRSASLNQLERIIRDQISVERGLNNVFSSTDTGRELNVTEVCRGCQNHCEGNLGYGNPYITGKIETYKFNNNWVSKWPNNVKKIILFPGLIENIDKSNIKKAVQIIINHYEIKQLIVSESLIDSFSKYLDKIQKNKIIFINSIEALNNTRSYDNIFFNIPTLTILFPWDNKTKIPVFLTNKFSKFESFNIILAPDHLRASNSYKALKIIDIHLTSIDEFIKNEII